MKELCAIDTEIHSHGRANEIVSELTYAWLFLPLVVGEEVTDWVGDDMNLEGEDDETTPRRKSFKMF